VKQTAQRVFHQTLASLDIPASMEKKLARNGTAIRAHHRELDLRGFREIVAVAFGKASWPMAQGLVRVLDSEFCIDGILVGPSAPPSELAGWKSFVGGHPVPNGGSFEAGRAILDRLARCDEKSLVFFLLSGGGSALVEQPLDSGVKLKDFQELNKALVTCGAPIEQMNAVRKHVSAVKGGRLAAAAARSMKFTLAVSDVPPGRESAIASGPTLPDPSTVADAERVVSEYNLAPKLPGALRSAFENRTLSETPKEGNAAFERSHFSLLLGEHELTHAAHHACEAEGYVCLCDHSTDDWPLEKAADHLLGQLAAHKAATSEKPVAVLADGELRSPVMGDGLGGRNAAFVLTCVPKIAGQDITVLSAGTDGIDGNSPAAGAVADGETLERARAAGLDPADFLRRSDAFNFFRLLGDAIITGSTGNNLRDLRIFLTK
jgi:glycerate 2-kinase